MSVPNTKTEPANPSPLTVQIQALNPETGEFKEKLLTLATGTKRDCLLGRHASCDLVLDSSEVSRIHGRIWCQDGQCFYTDLGSTDGSQINDREVGVNQVHTLQQNHLLRIGGFVLTVANQSNRESVDITANQISTWHSGDLTVRCIQAIDETHDVKTFRFVAEPSVLFNYKPGQFVTLELAIEGKRVMRSYSISSTPSRPHTLDITVKRVPAPKDIDNAPPGLVSNWLHDNISVGDQIKLKEPKGKFTCVDNPAPKLLFISAGSGITPMMSMSRWLCDTGANVDIIFIYSIRSPRDLIFRHELESMAARHSNFKLAVTLTRPEPGQAWQGYTGRLNQLTLQAIAPDLQERTVYVCGSNPFMQEIKTNLKALGLPMENYHQESFGSPKIKQKQVDKAEESNSQELQPKPEPANSPAVVTSKNQATVVIFDKSGQEIPCDEEDTILEIAEQADIELPSGCRMGACGACKLPLMSGEVNYDDAPECEPGHLLTCIAKPMGRVVIDY